MLVLRGQLRGLGANFIPGSVFATPDANTTGVVPIAQGTVFQSWETATGVTPEVVPWNLIQPALRDLLIDIGTRNDLEAKSLIPGGVIKSTCPPTSFVGNECYTGQVAAAIDLIPGAFEILSVPFNIAEVGISKTPRFDRAYVPSIEQRHHVELSVIKRSRELLSDVITAAIANWNAKIPYTPNGIGLLNGKKMSIAQVQSLVPGLLINPPNFSIVAPAPTNEEMTGAKGYTHWIDRGGWAIYAPVIQGKIPIWGGEVQAMPCISIACRCGGNAKPSCIRGGIPVGDVTGGFKVYVAIDQAPPWQFHAALIHEESSWLEKTGDKLAILMTKLGDLYCGGDAPATQQQMDAAVAERCVTSTGAACAKGAPGCTCTTPSATTQAAGGLTDWYVKQWCASWRTSRAPLNPQNVIPPMPDAAPLPPSFLPSTSPVPLWLVGLLGLAGGVALFSRRS